MAGIYNRDGYAITEGLQGCKVCDQAIDTAFRLAKERNESVILVDDDGTWLVPPDGSAATQIPDDD